MRIVDNFEGRALRRLVVHLVLGVASLTGAAMLGACTGVIGDAPATGGAAAAGPTAGATTPTAVVTDLPLARLTRTQYQNTIRDLFAPVVLPIVSPATDAIVDGYDDNVSAQTPGAAAIEGYHTAAVQVSNAAMANPAVLGCAPTSRAEEDDCANQFIASFARRAYRRPLTAEDTTALMALYTSVRTDGDDFKTAMAETIQAILQSPHFLYRVEIGAPVEGKPGVVALQPYEMASRLSYLLWDTMPDEVLFGAASELTTVDGIEKQARRMLLDPRAHDAMRKFFGQWLEFDRMNDLVKDYTAFPKFGSAVTEAMRQSADKFVDDIFFGNGSLTKLLTDDHAWVNDALAPTYGVPAPGSNELTLVQVDPTQRSGILTNAGVMAGFAHALDDAPVLRGKFVLSRFMCAPPPPVPANLPPPAEGTTVVAKTTRERQSLVHEQPACAGCHHAIDGIGFGFEHYDAVGAWRTEDGGEQVDASGWLPDIAELTGPFDGAIELAHKLAASPTVHACMASQFTRFAFGVSGTEVDRDKLAPVVAEFESKNLDMRELVVAITKSEAFRTRIVTR
jgi:hypothetical protein